MKRGMPPRRTLTHINNGNNLANSFESLGEQDETQEEEDYNDEEGNKIRWSKFHPWKMNYKPWEAEKYFFFFDFSSAEFGVVKEGKRKFLPAPVPPDCNFPSILPHVYK